MQQNLLIKECDRFEEKMGKVKNINGMSVAFVESYTRLIYQLLGNFPHHWDRKAPWADKFWDLSGHRTLNYHHSDEQKAALIVNAIDISKYIELKAKGFKNMNEAFYRGNKGNPSKFVDWFKDNYPREYCKLF